ncbi:hypothetical protein ACFC06_17665 [Nocardia sp. NPDC056064]|uniref:hypothetical protein n=1 Tax=Nocardia sp. NPDC056064 TaxID=3345701 RepID=UPI0035D94ED4
MASDANQVDLLAFALSEQRTIMTDPTNSVTVELTADGAIKAVRLSESGHRMTSAMVAELIVSLHTAGLAQAQASLEAALAGSLPTHSAVPVSTPDPAPSFVASAVDHLPAADVSVPVSGMWSAPAETRSSSRPPTDQVVSDPPKAAPLPNVLPAVPDPRTADAAPWPSEPDHASEPDDEDSYFRSFSVFEHDDHRKR